MNKLFNDFNFSNLLPQNQEEMLKIRFKNIQETKKEFIEKTAPKAELNPESVKGRRTNYNKPVKEESQIKISYNQKKKSLDINKKKPEKIQKENPINPKPFVELKTEETPNKKPVSTVLETKPVEVKTKTVQSKPVEVKTKTVQSKPVEVKKEIKLKKPVRTDSAKSNPIQAKPLQNKPVRQKEKRFVSYF